MRFPRLPLLCACGLISHFSVFGAGFTKEQQIDFYRDVSSRDLEGLATRSDGRLIAGPTLKPTAVDLGVDLVWDLEPAGTGQWLVASGPDGKILEVSSAAGSDTLTSRTWADLGTDQVFTILRLPDGRVVAGTSPSGQVVLFSPTGKKLAAVALAADSVFDLLSWDDGKSVLAATGNPGRIFQIDLAVLLASEPAESADAAADKSTAVKPPVADRGVSEFGAVRDRNIRCLAVTADGQVLAGSAPSGNLYRFESSGGAPLILLDHDVAEITDIYVSDTGDIFVAVVHSATPQKSRVITASKEQTPSAGSTPSAPSPGTSIMEVAPTNKFSGRSTVLKLPAGDGMPETVVSRAGLAIYRIEPRGNVLILPGGDNGELIGYDYAANRAITFAGSESAQLTDIVPVGDGNRYLILTNNPAGLSLLDFAAPGSRSLETRSLNLRTFSELGALRLDRLRHLSPADVQVAAKTNRGSDEAEGWSAWTPLAFADGGWKTAGLVGEYVKLKVELPESIPSSAEIDGGNLYFLPANRRPSLKAFQVVTPNFGLKLRPDSSSVTPPTVAQVIGSDNSGRSPSDEDRAKANLLASQVIPFPDAQLVTWTIDDADGDSFVATYSVRHEDSDQWINLAVNTEQSWVQFSRTTLRDGVYFTRLVVAETAPRPADQRLGVTFETDDLVIDRTAPEILEIVITPSPTGLRVEVAGIDSRSLLVGVDVALNNGRYFETEQTIDGILDQQAERFVATIDSDEVKGATAVEITLQDASGNRVSRWVELP